MVQIRRPRSRRRTLWRFCRFLLLTAVIPALFAVRLWLLPSSNTAAATPNQLRTSTTAQSTATAFPWSLDFSTPYGLHGSDVVELAHCSLSTLDRDNFTHWATPILNSTLSALHATHADVPSTVWTDVREEFLLQLLELHATSLDLCDWDRYRPTLPVPLTLPPLADPPLDQARLAILIVAHHDLDALTRLVKALYLPQHLILLHLDRWVDASFERNVRQLAADYDNVLVLQFGTVLYATDSVSLIHWRVLQWLVDSGLDYDYHVSLDGLSFPLLDATSFAQHLQHAAQPVWLGALTQNLQPVRSTQVDRLVHKRLLATKNVEARWHKRLPRSTFSRNNVPQRWIDEMNVKTHSGNQMVVSKAIVDQLVASKDVRQLMALSKYGCCCCLEEFTWAAALRSVGVEVPTEVGAVFQVWDSTGMHNAVLSLNASVTYRSEMGPDFTGNETWSQLVRAQAKGMLWARKFDQSDDSHFLIHKIKDRFWADDETDDDATQ